MIKIYQPAIPNFEPIGHRYTTPDTGQNIESVTTVIKAELALYAFSSQDAANRGTGTHKASQFYDEGDLNEATLPEVVVPYFKQYKLAKAHYGIQVYDNELMRYSKKYLYAGQIDKPARITCGHGLISEGDGILDLKTSNTCSVEKWWKWQTAPYLDMVYEEFKKLRGIELVRRWVLVLGPDKFKMVEHTEPQARNLVEFLTFLAAHNIKINNCYRKPKCEDAED